MQKSVVSKVGPARVLHDPLTVTEACVACLSTLLLPFSRYQLEDESAHLDEMPLMMSEEGFENDESDYHTLPRARTARRRRGLERFVCGGWKLLCARCGVCCCLVSRAPGLQSSDI